MEGWLDWKRISKPAKIGVWLPDMPTIRVCRGRAKAEAERQ